MEMDMWNSYDDFHSDLNLVSDFHDEDSTEIEINHNMFLLDESSQESAAAVEHPLYETLSTEIPKISDRTAMDKVMQTDDLKQGKIVLENECFFTKLHQQKINRLENQDPSSEDDSTNSSAYFSALSTQSSASLDESLEKVEGKRVKTKKSKKTKFRPLEGKEPTGFISVLKQEEWRPMEKERGLCTADFPRL